MSVKRPKAEVARRRWHFRFSNRALLSSSVFPAFVVGTAWVTLLYVVGLAMTATNISRIKLESLALTSVANVRFGSS